MFEPKCAFSRGAIDSPSHFPVIDVRSNADNEHFLSVAETLETFFLFPPAQLSGRGQELTSQDGGEKKLHLLLAVLPVTPSDLLPPGSACC